MKKESEVCIHCGWNKGNHEALKKMLEKGQPYPEVFDDKKKCKDGKCTLVECPGYETAELAETT